MTAIEVAELLALVAAAVASTGVFPPAAAALLTSTPAVASKLAELLAKRQAGEPLPAILKAELPDDAHLLAPLVDADTKADTIPAPPEDKP